MHQAPRFPTASGVFSFDAQTRAKDRNVVADGGTIDDEIINDYHDSLSLGLESQIGIEYSRCMAGGVLKLRAVLEGQYWGDVSGAGGNTIYSEVDAIWACGWPRVTVYFQD